MAHTIKYNSKLCIIELELQEDIFLDEVKEILNDLIEIVKGHNCYKILSDYRRAKIKLSTLEIYNLPQFISNVLSQLDISTHKFRRALISNADQNDVRFFETVNINQGQNTKIFQKYDEAQKWLIES